MVQLVRALLSSAVGFLIPAGFLILVPNHDQQHAAAAHYMPPKMPPALWLQQGQEQLREEEGHLHSARASYEENYDKERARVLAERLEKIQQEEQSVALRYGRESEHFYAVVRDKSAWLAVKHLHDLAIGKQQRRESGLYVNASPALAAWESAEKERQEQDFRDLATQRQAASTTSTSTQRTPQRARTPRATQTARQETLGDCSSPRTSSPKPSRTFTRRTSTQSQNNFTTASAGQLEQDLDARGSSSTSSMIIPRGGCPLPTLQTQLRQALLENYAEAEGEAIFMHGYLSREHEFIQQKNDRELQERHRRELDGGAHDPHQNSSPCSPSSKQIWQKQERRMQADDWRRLEELREQEVPLRMQQRKEQRQAIGQSVLTDLRMVLLGVGGVENQDLHFWDEKVKRAEAAAIGFLRSFEDVGEDEIALVRDLLHALRRVAAGVITRSTPPPLLMKNVGILDGAIMGTSEGSVLFQIAVNDAAAPAEHTLERLQKQDREKLEEEFLHPNRRLQYRRSICEWDEDLPTPTTATRHQPAGFVSSNSIEEAAAAKRTSVKWHPLGQMWRELAAEIEAAEVANLKDLLREVEMVNTRGRAAARQLTAEDFARMSELCRRHIVSAADVGEGVAGFLGVAAEEESDTPVGPPTIDELEIDMDREAGEHLQLLSADVNTEDLQEEPDVTARDVDWPLPGGHFSPEQVVDQEERPLLPAFFRSRQELEEAESRRRRETMESGARQAISELCPPRTFAFSLSGCGAGVSAERKEEVVRVLRRRHERDLEAGRQLRLASGWYGVEEVEQWALGEQEWQREFLQAVLAGGASARASRRIISHI